MLDGIRNTVIESDIVSLDAPTGSKENFAGNGFYVKERVLKDQVQDGARDFDWAAERRWKIANLNRTHYASGKPSSYQIAMKGGVLPLLSKGDSWIARRASFAHKALWVVKDEEGPRGGRMWPSGKYVPQTREEPKDSVGRWVREGQGNIDNEDIVFYLTVGACIPHPVLFAQLNSNDCRHDAHPAPGGLARVSIRFTLIDVILTVGFAVCPWSTSASSSNRATFSPRTRAWTFLGPRTCTAPLRSPTGIAGTVHMARMARMARRPVAAIEGFHESLCITQCIKNM